MRQCLDYANQIGIETIRQIRLLAISLNCNLWMIIENINKNIDAFSSMRQRKKVVEFHLYLKDLFNYKNFNEIVYKFFNYVPLSKSDNGCQKVLAFLNEYENTKIITLKDVLDEMDQKLLESENKDEIDEQNEVRVMTMHSSKGCESPVVFIPAMEDDIMPGIDLENIEEKRRLFYVSLTRAKYGVFITWAKQRTGQEIHMQGRKMLNKQRSVFLDEIDKK
ncbi:MAG TPA: 3'-5' exonuclease [Patescibacteria group bacterium]|nr:3'-5' exonuclease [Patescibacteria group bacterium]